MLGFLIAAFAGYVTPRLDAPVATPIAKALGAYFTVAANEKRLISFMAALLVAGICAAVFDSGTPLAVIVGATLGYFGTRIVAVVKKVIEGRTET